MPEITLKIGNTSTQVKIGDKLARVPFFLKTDTVFVSSPSEGESATIEVFTNPYNPWTVTDSCTWLTTGSSGTGHGFFSIVVAEQTPGGDQRSGRVTVSSRAVDVSINVTQSAIADNVVLTPDSSIFGVNGGGPGPISVVSSSVKGQASTWTAAIKNDPYNIISSCTNSGNSGDTLYVTANQNTSYADCIFGTIEVSCGVTSAILTIYQNGTAFNC